MQLQNYLRIALVGFVMLCSVAAASPVITHAQSQTLQGTQTQATPAATPAPASAQTDTNSTAGQTIVNPLKVGSLTDLLDLLLKAAVQLGTVILTLALIWTGFKFVAARGAPEKIQSARTALLWTVIGGLILLGAQAIETVIQSTVGTLTS